MGAAAETGIHYRNGQELVWAYGLRKSMSYEEARQLMAMLRQAGALPDGEKKDKRKKAGAPQERPRLYTRQVRQAFDRVETEEELWRFLQEYQEELGQLHETAYRKFVQNDGKAGRQRRSAMTLIKYIRVYIGQILFLSAAAAIVCVCLGDVKQCGTMVTGP